MSDPIRCAACAALGRAPERITELATAVTTLAFSPPFLDSSGRRHDHDGNRTTQRYRCSSGHTWDVDSYKTCWCGWSGAPAPPPSLTAVRSNPPKPSRCRASSEPPDEHDRIPSGDGQGECFDSCEACAAGDVARLLALPDAEIEDAVPLASDAAGALVVALVRALRRAGEVCDVMATRNEAAAAFMRGEGQPSQPHEYAARELRRAAQAIREGREGV